MNLDISQISHPNQLIELFDQQGYVADLELATIIFLLFRLEKPLLLEGNPGVGKTEVAQVLAGLLDTELIRLQCYEGLDVNAAVYEWNYQKQLLSIKIQEQSDLSLAQKEEHIFGEDFLLQRPLLKAISSTSKAPVLLIDEVDRADEEFEAFLLELLSAFQISIPELGTIKAIQKPHVILTSNRTRELSDALKRRCLYHWVSYPDIHKEKQILKKHIPDIEEGLADQMTKMVQLLREMKLNKAPGIAESIDWARGLLALGYKEINAESLSSTMGAVVKSASDMEQIQNQGLDNLITRSEAQ
ncbi:MAG: MoxR family ATPase [Bacteroidia bacterium]|nr:MoxR family ATPase [Bacteroidia bacterium]